MVQPFIWGHIKSTSSNPLTLFALCNYPALLTAGILLLQELMDSSIEEYTADVQWEHHVFIELIDSYPGLFDCLTNGEEDIIHAGELLGKGASVVQADDTKTLKSTILEWLVPRGQASDHGFSHKVTSTLLCPAGLDWSYNLINALKSSETAVHGDQWPIFLYASYDYDPEDPWKELLRSEILICGFKHVFTSPSSINKEPKVTHSRNAYLHGMKSVMKGSLAYISMQIQFSLRLLSVFLYTDMVANSGNFYHSILDLLEDPDESEEVTDLMMWWMHGIFINSSSQWYISKNSTLAKFCTKQATLQEQASTSTSTT
ncbi:hypothetical protein BDR04DRAFT_1128370 [Suillus decipiens]|nr:hypothetical protein BDR04DRAFT_1128370 [Suillus decipiens]